MLRADGVVYIFLLLLITRCVTLETDDKRCVKEEKTGEEKDNCSDLALLRRAGKILARTGRIPSGSWICLRHRNEMNRTTNDVHVHHHGGIAGQNTDPKPPVPGVCFSKAPETFRARKAIFN